jgi:hypothetical protein
MEGAANVFLESGLLGASVLVLATVIGLMARHIISLYKRIDELNNEWREDTATSLTSVTTALATVRETITALNAQNKG